MPARSFNPAIAALREQIAQMEGDGGPSRGALPFGSMSWTAACLVGVWRLAACMR